MNMKKTIAAAAAGAMAVSATATAASAATTPVIAPQGTFTYSLVKSFAKEKIGTATITSERQIAGLSATNSTVLINLVDNTDGVVNDSTDLYIDVKTDANATLSVQSTSDNTMLVNRSFILDGDDADVGAGFAQDDITAIKGTNTQYLVLDETSAVERTYNSILVKYTAQIEHKAEKTNVLSNAFLKGASGTLDGEILGIGTASSIASYFGTAASADEVTNYNEAYRQVMAFTAYDADGTIVDAPMLSNTNTTRYGDGVPNIIAYLEGYDDVYGAANWYIKDSSHFPAMTDIGTAENLRDPDWKYIGRNTEFGTNVQDGKDYYGVMATLNDTVANYDVVFTFQTATKKVYDAANGRANSGDGVVGTYDEDGTGKYMVFGQHQYGYYGNEYATGLDYYTPFGETYYFANPGTSYNLFTGALIVNDYYSMQLSDSTVFSYSATTLSFDYDTLQENALASYNTWMDYIQSLRLATSTEWYWDSMTVTWETPVADTAGVGEGLEDDDVTLEEEEVPADEEVVVEEPVAPVENPPTGNSAVALAVIPVALAAAAIVAKKRK
jgi:hypothetical protein